MLLKGYNYITEVYFQIDSCFVCQKCNTAIRVHNPFPFIPPQKLKNQFCGRTWNKSLSLIASKMLSGQSCISTKFCIVLVRIQLLGSVIWQQHYIQRIWLYQWKIQSLALCKK